MPGFNPEETIRGGRHNCGAISVIGENKKISSLLTYSS